MASGAGPLLGVTTMPPACPGTGRPPSDPDVYDAVALIQSNFSTAGSGPGNLEVIAHTGNRLDHYWRDDANPFPWHAPSRSPARPAWVGGALRPFHATSSRDDWGKGSSLGARLPRQGVEWDCQPISRYQAVKYQPGQHKSEAHPRPCQSATNPASRSLASHVLAIEASRIYLRFPDVQAGHAWE